MLRNYFISAIRNFSRNKVHSSLNILGLAIGMAAALLILQYVRYENSFDKFHTSADRIYRIQYNNYQNGNLTFECAAAVPAAGPAMKANFPEVEAYVRMLPTSGVFTYNSPERGRVTFREKKVQVVDPSIFDVFDIELLKGNRETCLDSKEKILLSESTARKYFGDTEAMGKILVMDGDREFEVTGIFGDIPENSHIKFGMLASNTLINDWWEDWQTSWGWYDHNTYIVINESASAEELQKKWNEFLEADRGEDWENNNSRQEFILQPLTSIHLYGNLLQESEPEERGDAASVKYLGIISLFILIIAWVNYINLSTARSMERANEVGVRKVMGAKKSQLGKQFLMEAILTNLFAALLALGIVLIAWPFFVELTGRALSFSITGQPAFWVTLGLFFLVGSFFSGFYPAMVLSSFLPVRVLKGKVNVSSTGNFVRKSLVIFQFATSVVLIIGAWVVFEQLHYMKSRDLGVDIDKTLVIYGPGIVDSLYNDHLSTFKDEVMNLSGVSTISASTNVPGNEIIWTRGIRRLSGGPESSITVYNVGVDEDYVPAFGLDVLAGRNFSKDMPGDKSRILINKSLADALEYMQPEEAIGREVRLAGDTLEIAGVLADYHQMSLKTKPAPMVFLLSNPNSFYAIKVQSDNYLHMVENVQAAFDRSFEGNPFDYFFLDQFFNRQYDQEKRFGQTFGLFTFIAILIACLGLFGLASYMTSRRTKEIGIRKVLGSSIQDIVKTLTVGFIKPVLIAIVIAWPLAYFAMETWLDKFPYRVSISPHVYLAAGMIVLLVAIISVAYQTVKTSRVNPADTLRYE